MVALTSTKLRSAGGGSRREAQRKNVREFGAFRRSESKVPVLRTTATSPWALRDFRKARPCKPCPSDERLEEGMKPGEDPRGQGLQEKNSHSTLNPKP